MTDRVNAEMIKEAIEAMKTDFYYFGVRFAGEGFNPRVAVLNKLREWKKNDPRPWDQRQYKPYFLDWSDKH